MIAKRYKRQKVFGNEIYEIEGWQEALVSEEMYVPHHVLEWLYSSKELADMNRYDKVNPDELIWLPKSFHDTAEYIHKQKIDVGKRTALKTKGLKRNKETIDKLKKASSFNREEVQSKARVNREKNLEERLKHEGIRYKNRRKLLSKFVELFKEHYGEDKLYNEDNTPSELYRQEFKFWNSHNKTPRWDFIRKNRKGTKLTEEHKQKIREKLKKAWDEGRHQITNNRDSKGMFCKNV